MSACRFQSELQRQSMAFNLEQPSVPLRTLAGLIPGCFGIPGHGKADPRPKAVRDPKLKSSSVLIIDQSDSSVLYSRHPDVAMPIASITKLMTALVVLDAKQPLDETASDHRCRPRSAEGRVFAPHRRHHPDPGRPDASGSDVVRKSRRARLGQQLSRRNARHGGRHECQGRRARHDALRTSSIPPACRARTWRAPRICPSW